MVDEQKIEEMKKEFQNKKSVENAVKVFMNNSYYKSIYENANERVKDYYGALFYCSLIQKNSKKASEIYELANEKMTGEDWEYLAEHTNNNMAKYFYMQRKSGKEIAGKEILNEYYRED